MGYYCERPGKHIEWGMENEIKVFVEEDHEGNLYKRQNRKH